MTEAAVKISDAELELQLPRPVGYRVLVALPQPEETYEGTSILKTDTERSRDHIMSIIGLVVELGDQAYGDEERFPTGPWCKEGDYVAYGKFIGQKLQYKGVKFLLLFDDQIIMRVDKPTDLDPTFNLSN